MQLELAKKIYSLIDLTSLNTTDTEKEIQTLCQKATSSFGSVAAVCTYPRFVSLTKELLKNTSVKIATVANFPEGEDSLPKVISTIEQALQQGADEIDVVFPYKDFLSGKESQSVDFISECRKVSPNFILKIILETGAFENDEQIKQASARLLDVGVNFLKTSTGKIPVGATVPAAKAMLEAITSYMESHQVHLHKSISRNAVPGLKVSGGIRTFDQALVYYRLVAEHMGPNWISPNTFRIGASQLVDELLNFQY